MRHRPQTIFQEAMNPRNPGSVSAARSPVAYAPDSPLFLAARKRLPLPRRLLGQIAIEFRDQPGFTAPRISAVKETVAHFLMESLPARLLVSRVDWVEQRPRAARRFQIAGSVADHQHAVGHVAVPHCPFENLLLAPHFLTADRGNQSVDLVLRPFLDESL